MFGGMKEAGEALEGVRDELRQQTKLLQTLARGHFFWEGFQPWELAYGEASIAPAASADLLTLTPPDGQMGVLLGLANDSDTDGPWSDSAGLGGLSFMVLLGGSPVAHLSRLNSPWGRVGVRGDIWLIIRERSPLVIRARNTHATDTVGACAQAHVCWFSTQLGMQWNMASGRPVS